MDFPIYTSRDLYAIMYDRRLEAPSNFFLNNFFPNTHTSDREEIIFEKISSTRRLAPFVRPVNVGQPMFKREGSNVEMFKPAYIKPKDAVRPADHLSRQPGDLFTATPRTPLQNYNAEVARIAIKHRDGIQRTWEWLAAQAALYAKVTIKYSDSEVVEIDFSRAANHTVVKAANFWDDTDTDILEDIQTWSDRMAVAAFGGIPSRLICGVDAAKALRKNDKVLKQMDKTVRGNSVEVKTGLLFPDSVEAKLRYIGTLGEGLEAWVYNDFYEDNAGASVPFMNSKDVLLASPNQDGFKAFGAILDEDASLQPLDIFTKMWTEKDPSGRLIMSQSAPLMIPVNPNRTLRARVLAADSE